MNHRRILNAVWLLIATGTMSAAEIPLDHVDVFTSGEDGYHTYRIPAIERAADGTLIAFAEGRKYNSADPGFHGNDIDLVMKRSTDGGKTWSRMVVVEDPGERWSAANPATVLDRQTGCVLVFYVRCQPDRSSATARTGTDDILTLVRSSSDRGETWSEPLDITRMARDYERWPFCVVGPGGAIQTQNGRLIAACCTKKPNWVSYAIYSDDHGKTWQRGSLFPGDIECNESQAIQWIDGQILLDVRQVKGSHRWIASSRDGGQTWDAHHPGVDVSPVCCAIERMSRSGDCATTEQGDRNTVGNADARQRILWTGPKGPGRNNLVARLSDDGGRTFPIELPVADGPAAYSDLTLLSETSAGVLWERGNYRHITFTRLTAEFLEQTPEERKGG